MTLTESQDFPLCDEDFDYCDKGEPYKDCSECPLKVGPVKDTLDNLPIGMFKAMEGAALLEMGRLSRVSLTGPTFKGHSEQSL